MPPVKPQQPVVLKMIMTEDTCVGNIRLTPVHLHK